VLRTSSVKKTWKSKTHRIPTSTAIDMKNLLTINVPAASIHCDVTLHFTNSL